jgi:hypothetical protein
MQGTHDEIAAQFREIQAMARALGRDADALWLGAGIAMGAGSEGERAAEHIRGRSAPVVPRDPDQAIDEIRKLLALGVNLVSIGFTWSDPADYASQLASFGRDVIAKLRT